MFKFFQSTPVRLVTLFLILQAAFMYNSVRAEFIPPSRSLSEMPHELGPWVQTQEGIVDKETMDVLKADDTLNRVYQAPGRPGVSFFVAGFRTQRNGKSPHSPKNCLPGSGWIQVSSENYGIDVGRPDPIIVNRYVIMHGTEKELVLYWYQSRGRVVADEFKAKFWVVADAMRYNRTDTALVRVIVPIVENNEAAAVAASTDFVKEFFPTLQKYLPV